MSYYVLYYPCYSHHNIDTQHQFFISPSPLQHHTEIHHENDSPIQPHPEDNITQIDMESDGMSSKRYYIFITLYQISLIKFILIKQITTFSQILQFPAHQVAHYFLVTDIQVCMNNKIFRISTAFIMQLTFVNMFFPTYMSSYSR